MVLRGDAPRPAAAGHGRAQPARGRGLRPRLRRRQPARDRRHAAVLQRARPRHHHAAGQGRSSCRWCRPSSGFDPRFQFVHEDDVIRAILFVLDGRVQGIYNVAGDGLLPWSEVAAICGKRTFPLPPLGLGPAVARRCTPARASTCRRSCSTCSRYGRGVDNRRLKQVGFGYDYTSAGTVADFVEALRLRRTVGQHASPSTSTSATSSSSSATPPPSSATPDVGQRASKPSVAVGGPVPGLAGEVVEPVAAGVAGQPLEAGAAAGADTPPPLQVKSTARPRSCIDWPGRRGGRAALRGGLLVDVVVAGAAVVPRVSIWPSRGAVAAAAQVDRRRRRRVEHRLERADDRAGDGDRAAAGARRAAEGRVERAPPPRPPPPPTGRRGLAAAARRASSAARACSAGSAADRSASSSARRGGLGEAVLEPGLDLGGVGGLLVAGLGELGEPIAGRGLLLLGALRRRPRPAGAGPRGPPRRR